MRGPRKLTAAPDSTASTGVAITAIRISSAARSPIEPNSDTSASPDRSKNTPGQGWARAILESTNQNGLTRPCPTMAPSIVAADQTGPARSPTRTVETVVISGPPHE